MKTFCVIYITVIMLFFHQHFSCCPQENYEYIKTCNDSDAVYFYHWLLSCSRLLEVRGRIYELLTHCIPADIIMKVSCYWIYFWADSLLPAIFDRMKFTFWYIVIWKKNCIDWNCSDVVNPQKCQPTKKFSFTVYMSCSQKQASWILLVEL